MACKQTLNLYPSAFASFVGYELFMRMLTEFLGPTFIMPRAVLGSYFTIQLIGSTLHQGDIISIRSTDDTCGDPGTEVMDSRFVQEEPGRPLNRLGTVESFSTSENAVTGEREMTWTSWAMRIKDTADRRLKICYCSYTAAPCLYSGSTTIFAGLLDIRGPSKGDIELVGTINRLVKVLQAMFAATAVL